MFAINHFMIFFVTGRYIQNNWTSIAVSNIVIRIENLPELLGLVKIQPRELIIMQRSINETVYWRKIFREIDRAKLSE